MSQRRGPGFRLRGWAGPQCSQRRLTLSPNAQLGQTAGAGGLPACRCADGIMAMAGYPPFSDLREGQLLPPRSPSM